MSVQDPNPLNRPFTWSFSTSQSTVDATKEYFATAQNPGVWYERFIRNTAYDIIEGTKKRRSDLTIRVSGNIATSPFTIASTVVDCTNAIPWAGGTSETWLCTGYSATQESELVGTEVLNFWKFNATFTYRSDGWYIRTQNVGYNEFVYGSGIDAPPTAKRRISVTTGVGVSSFPNKPWPLDTLGRALDPLQAGLANSEITFRAYKPVDFAATFGDPPA